jgi:hypothetical protein
MKRLLLASILATVSLSAGADGFYYPGYHRHGYSHGGSGWVAPAIIGGAIAYGLTRPPVVYVEPQPPVYAIPQPPTQPAVPYGYHWEQVLDANCNCYRTVLVQN